jgi:hypothetical protein
MAKYKKSPRLVRSATEKPNQRSRVAAIALRQEYGFIKHIEADPRNQNKLLRIGAFCIIDGVFGPDCMRLIF